MFSELLACVSPFIVIRSGPLPVGRDQLALSQAPHRQWNYFGALSLKGCGDLIARNVDREGWKAHKGDGLLNKVSQDNLGGLSEYCFGCGSLTHFHQEDNVGEVSKS